jgi:hypothetical protein
VCDAGTGDTAQKCINTQSYDQGQQDQEQDIP